MNPNELPPQVRWMATKWGRRWLLFLAAVVIAWSIADWLIR
jgi:hypothetical protein